MATFSKVLLGLGPLAHWSLGEPVGASVISDLSGNGYGATYTGYISFNQTAITDHPCARFYGGYGIVNDQSALRLNGAHTIIGICKPLTLPANIWPGGIRKGNSATANGYVLFTDSSGSVYFKRNNVSIGFSPGVSIGVSTIVGFSYSGSVITAYKNGSLKATQSVTFPTNSGTDQIWLGRGDNTGDQIWSDLAIFNRSLTAYEHLLLADAAGLATLPRVTIGNNVTVSGNGAGDCVAIIDATTKTLVKLVEPDTSGNWTDDMPEGEYYALYFGDGCQPICHGPYTLTAS